jgi:predicted dehydrogenase
VQVEVTGVTSLQAKRREAFGAEFGVPVFASAAEMLPAVDVLDICTPPYAHEEAILAAAAAGKGVLCEKPLTGAFGPAGAGDAWRGDQADKVEMLAEVVARLGRIASAVRDGGALFGYAENFVYAPAVQKEREIIATTGAQVLRMIGEQSHSGSHSPSYGIWRQSGGGSLMGKACHPLSGVLYLKRVEGLARDGQAIRPATVSARTHELTRLESFRDAGFVRTDYRDIEDFGFIHVTFADGTVADVYSCEFVLGGVYDYIQVFANNHRTMCHISTAGLVDTYNPKGEQFADIYLAEKVSTQEGWSRSAPDENFSGGYLAEMQDFMTAAAGGTAPQADLDLALDTITTIYAAYLSAQRAGAEADIPLL